MAFTGDERYDQGRSDVPELLTLSELAERLRISRSGAYRLIRSGALQPIYLDDRPRFRAGDVEALIDSRGSPRDKTRAPVS